MGQTESQTAALLNPYHRGWCIKTCWITTSLATKLKCKLHKWIPLSDQTLMMSQTFNSASAISFAVSKKITYIIALISGESRPNDSWLPSTITTETKYAVNTHKYNETGPFCKHFLQWDSIRWFSIGPARHLWTTTVYLLIYRLRASKPHPAVPYLCWAKLSIYDIFGGWGTRGPMTLKLKLSQDLHACIPPSFIFLCLIIWKLLCCQTYKQTKTFSWKQTSTSLRYAMPVENQINQITGLQGSCCGLTKVYFLQIHAFLLPN